MNFTLEILANFEFLSIKFVNKTVYKITTFPTKMELLTGGRGNFGLPLWTCLDTKLRKFDELGTLKQGVTFEIFTPKQGEYISNARGTSPS